MQLHEQAPAKVRSAADKRIAENKDSKLINSDPSHLLSNILILTLQLQQDGPQLR